MMNMARMVRPMVSSVVNNTTAPMMVRNFCQQTRQAAPRVPTTMSSGLSLTSRASLPAASALMHASQAVQHRDLTSWRLRPYAVAGTMGALPLTTVAPGFSKVNLSLMIMPWKALPTALLLLPAAWALPAFFRFAFSNGSRYATAGFFSSVCQLVLAFIPKPTFENMFGELAFYAVVLFGSTFAYMLFPEMILNDLIAMHFMALFSICFIPLAFTFMPLFHGRTYFFC